MRKRRFPLEYELHSKLQTSSGAERRDLSEQRAGDVGTAEAVRIRMIGRIERLTAEFQTALFPNRERLRECRIPVLKTRSANHAAARIAGPFLTLRDRTIRKACSS